ncbi:hypothetical protein G9A89_011467 [Geosiphon pyriformis]|nr:hypothetical protein G9A89_011467 [Geosiphon pyriformis]
MKKATKVSGSKGGFKVVASRKKRKGGVLAESVDNSEVANKAFGNRSWGSEVGDTTESESIDMEEECLVKETNVDYGENGAFTGGDPDQMPKSLHVKTKKVLGKPLGVIDYGTVDADGDVLDESLLLLPSFSVKPFIQVPVCKSFTLDIDLVVVVGVNGFGGVSTPSKFGGIIWATFTSEEAMMTAANLANDHGVVVNTNLKRPVNNHTNRAIVLKEIPVGTSLEAVRTAVAEFGIIKSIKMQLVGLWQKVIIELEDQDQADFLASKWSILIGKNTIRVARTDIDKQLWDARDNFRALLYTLPMGTTAHDFYSRTRCATVCFSLEVELVNAMATTPVIKSFGLRWSRLSLASCAVCEKFGHTSLGCRTVKGAGIAGGRKAPLSVQDQSRLAKIYAKRSAPISCPLAFGALPLLSLSGGKASSGSVVDGKPTPPVAKDLEKRLVSIENGLVTLAKQIDGLAKRLDLLVPVVSQPGHRCWLPVVATPQNSGSNVTLNMNLSMADGHESATIVDSSTSPHVVKLENMLEGLSKSVLILSARFDSLALAGGKVRPWIINKFDGVRVFTTGLDSGYLGAGVAVVMDTSLARHVCKVSEVPGWLLSIKLLFKNRLSVSILGLYAGASSAVWFSQAGEINSIVAKAVNESSFVILGGNFNEDGSHKCASFKKCLDLGLINSLVGSPAVKMLTWENSRGVKRTIDYVFVSPNLVNVIVHHKVSGVSEHFDTDHQAVSVSLGLSGLLNIQLSSFRKQANRDRWKFDFKGADESKWIDFKCATLANATMFSDEFAVSVRFLDLDAM